MFRVLLHRRKLAYHIAGRLGARHRFEQMSGNHARDSNALHLMFITPGLEGEERKPNLYEEWKGAVNEYMPEGWEHEQAVKISVFRGRLGDIEATRLACDCIVSPANSYGIMDGGFDLELSRVLRGRDGDEWTLTNHCQTRIQRASSGYLPPGSCLIVPVPEAASGNPWGARFLAMLPTMRTPEVVSWNRDLVYNAMWSLLNAVAQHNLGVGASDMDPLSLAPSGERIRTVLMTGLGTGTGAIPARVCARQMVLAAKHFVEGVPVGPRWESVRARNEEITETFQI